MTNDNQTIERKPQQQQASNEQKKGALSAQYGAIGSAAVLAALQFRKPATPKR